MYFRGILATLCLLVPLSAFAEESVGTGTIALNEIESDQGSVTITSPEEELIFTEEESASLATKRTVPVSQAPANIVVIPHEEIVRSPTLSLPEVIQRVAGVDMVWLTAADTQISIRGFADPLTEGDQIAVFIDGRQVNQSLVGGTFWSTLPISRYDIKRIEVIKGPMSSLHGDRAFLGIINIITFDPSEARTTLAGGGGMYWAARGDFVNSGTFTDKLWYKITGTYKRDDEVEDVAGNGRGNDRNMFGATAMIDYHPAKATHARLTGGISHGSYVMQAGGLSKWDITQGFVMGDASHDFGKAGELSFKSWWRRGQAGSPNLFTVGTNGSSIIDNVSAELNHNISFDVNEWFKNSTVFGFEYRALLTSDFAIGGNIHNFAGFLQNEMRFWKQLIFTAGFRLDYQKDFTGLNTSAHGSLVWIANPMYTMRVSGSLAYNTPTFYNFFLDFPNIAVGPVTINAMGNPNLSSETVIYAEMGNIVDPLDWLTLHVDLFYYRMRDLIVPTLTAATPTAFNASFVNRGGAQAIGGEAGAEARAVKGLTLYANWAYEYFQAINGNPDATANLGNPLNKVNAGVRYAADFGLFADLDFHWIQSHWRKAGAVLNFDNTPIRKIGDIYTLNARVGYQPVKDRLEIAVIANNILNDNTPYIPATDPTLGIRAAERPGFRLLGTISYTFK